MKQLSPCRLIPRKKIAAACVCYDYLLCLGILP